MFRSTEFQLYYDLALALMHKNREDRAENELLQPDGEYQVQITKTFKAHLASQQVNERTKQILNAIRLRSKNLSGLLTNYSSPPKMPLVSGNLSCQNWFATNTFRSFKKLGSLLKLLAAVMQEHTVICYGKTSVVSSVVLGVESLLRPF